MVLNVSAVAPGVAKEKSPEYNIEFIQVGGYDPAYAAVNETVLYENQAEAKPAGRYAQFDSLTDDERILLAHVIYHESRGEPIEGQIAVAEIVLNRILAVEFPDNVNDVIYAKNQFSCSPYAMTAPIYDPGSLMWAGRVIDMVVWANTYRVPERYVYFNTSKPKTSDYIKIGNHYFY